MGIDNRNQQLRYFCEAVLTVLPANTYEGVLAEHVFPYETNYHLVLRSKVGTVEFTAITAEPWSIQLICMYPISDLNISGIAIKNIRREMEICMDMMHKYKRIKWKPYRAIIKALREPIIYPDDKRSFSTDDTLNDPKYNINFRAACVARRIEIKEGGEGQ